MYQRMGRRSALRKIAKGLTASLLALTASRQTRKPTDAAALEICFWQYQHSVCQGGELLERWCYICCAGIDCETFFCEWRPSGTC